MATLALHPQPFLRGQVLIIYALVIAVNSVSGIIERTPLPLGFGEIPSTGVSHSVSERPVSPHTDTEGGDINTSKPPDAHNEETSNYLDGDAGSAPGIPERPPPSYSASDPTAGVPSHPSTSQKSEGLMEDAETQKSDIDFLNHVKLQISISNEKAVEDPASHCAGEGQNTSFCWVIREYAAALDTNPNIDCVVRTMPTKKQRRSSKSRLFPGKPKNSRSLIRKIFSGKSLAGASSFSETPTKEEAEARQAQAHKEYETQAKRTEERGREVLTQAGATGDMELVTQAVQLTYTVQEILQASFYIQAGCYIMMISAKQVLSSLKTHILTTTSEIVISLAEIYKFILSNLSGPTTIAWHFIDLVLGVIQEALNIVSQSVDMAEAAVMKAFLILTDMDVLVRFVAKRKADLSAEMNKGAVEVNQQIKAEVDTGFYTALESNLLNVLVERVLSIIDSRSSVSISISEGAIGGTRPTAPPAPGPQPASGYVHRFQTRAAAAGPVGPQAPEMGATTLQGGSRLTGTAWVHEGLEGIERAAQQREQEGFERIRAGLSLRGVLNFHTSQADYVMNTRGTGNDICQADVLLFPSTEEEGRKIAPGPFSARAAAAVSELIAQRIEKVEPPSMVLFRSPKDIENYVKNLWTVERQKVGGENEPAPSYNTLVSTGCATVSDVLRSQFLLAWSKRDIFDVIKEDPILRERLRKRVALLVNYGIVPTMVHDIDKNVGGTADAKLVNYLHQGYPKPKRGANKREVIPTFGFLDICDRACYRKPQSRRGDVLASFVFSTDHTLMKIQAMLQKVMGYAIMFYCLGQTDSWQKDGGFEKQFSQNCQNRDALEESISIIRAFSSPQKTKIKLREEDGVTLVKSLVSMSRFTNVLLRDDGVKSVMNLLMHMWIVARGIHNSAEGFKPGQSVKAPVKSANVAAIFAKLWYESDPSIDLGGQQLKPFGAAFTSAGLQIAFFLHTIVGEYKTSVLKRFGSAVKSFFVSIFKSSSKISLPASWEMVQNNARRHHKIDLAKYKGALSVISQLSEMFRKRFLIQLYQRELPTELQAFYLMIQALVGMWLNPYNENFDLSNPRFESAKKLFYYNLFFHPQGPAFVAHEIIAQRCSAFRWAADLGIVVDVMDRSGERSSDASLYLKRKPLPIMNKVDLLTELTRLMAIYVDPLTIVKVALDFGKRCDRKHDTPRGDWLTSTTPPPQEHLPESSLSPSPSGYETLDSSETPTPPTSGKGQSFVHFGLNLRRKLHVLRKGLDPVLGGRRGGPYDMWGIGGRWAMPYLGSKLVVDIWCQRYKENLLGRMVTFKPSNDPHAIEKQFEDILESVTEVRIAIKYEIWSTRFKCLWMSGNVNQEAMKAERSAMVNYAISRGGRLKGVARAAGKVKNWLKSKFSVTKKEKTSHKPWIHGVLHSGTEIWRGQYYQWPEP